MITINNTNNRFIQKYQTIKSYLYKNKNKFLILGIIFILGFFIPYKYDYNLYISHSMFQHKFRQLKHSFHRFDLFDKEKSCVPSVKSYSSHTEMLRR